MSYTWVRATVDQKISVTPGYLGCVIVTPDSDDDTAYVSLYDGESAKDPKIIRVRCGAGRTTVVRFQPPLVLFRGLFLDIEDHAEEVLIQHSTEPE